MAPFRTIFDLFDVVSFFIFAVPLTVKRIRVIIASENEAINATQERGIV